MIDCIKIILMTMYFDYTISDMFREINRNKKLQTHFKIQNNFTKTTILGVFKPF